MVISKLSVEVKEESAIASNRMGALEKERNAEMTRLSAECCGQLGSVRRQPTYDLDLRASWALWARLSSPH